MTDPAPDDPWTVWARSMPGIDGTYRVEVSCGPDAVRQLDRDEALAYAAEVARAGVVALHDARVFAWFRREPPSGTPSLTLEQAVGVITDLRGDRPPIDAATTAPLVLAPGVNEAGRPFVSVGVAGLDPGQWAVDDCLAHAEHVLECLAAADLDQALVRYLVGCEVDEDKAQRIVEDLPNVNVPRA